MVNKYQPASGFSTRSEQPVNCYERPPIMATGNLATLANVLSVIALKTRVSHNCSEGLGKKIVIFKRTAINNHPLGARRFSISLG